MGRGLDKGTLRKQWDKCPKDWYSIYQWERITGVGYSEWIAEWIEEAVPSIRLNVTGLRERSFRRPDHRGQAELQTGIEQVTEKRFLRAMFNLSDIPLLGKAIDYEIPLKETGDASKGDIDLFCVSSDSALCIEGKKANSSESILKPLLQAFTYTMLIATCRQRFYDDYGLDSSLKLTPTVLTFKSAKSGYQLRTRDQQPNLMRLIRRLNECLNEADVERMRFFEIDDRKKSIAGCLTLKTEPNGDKKPVFRDGFVWDMFEHPVGK